MRDPGGDDPDLVGGKAAALAVAAAAGLPVLDGMVLTTTFVADVDGGAALGEHPALDQVLAFFGEQSLAVRSSSPVEDQAASSMAGRFASVLDVAGPQELVTAVGKVLASRQVVADDDSSAGADDPMAVLVQPYTPSRAGGVLFGVDPVTGRSDRLVVVAADDPDAVVSGEVDGTRNELDLEGSRTDDGDDATLPQGLRRELAALARAAEAAFGAPQDVEWLVDGTGRVRLLQSRPVTTVVRGVPRGPLYGPGPVAETFPEPLSRLERDLWVPPLDQAMREALVLAGTRRRDALDGPLVVAPGGRVAVDLEATGDEPPVRRRWYHRLDVVGRTRAVASAWRVGRLRAALPELARDVVDRADDRLRAVDGVGSLSDRQLVALVERCRASLVSLHAHEILMGLVVDPAAPELTGVSVAMRVLGEARRDGRDDRRIIAENPVVLALTAPRVGGSPLPRLETSLPAMARSGEEADRGAILREALRLRVRWYQELSARAAWEVGRRLDRAGSIGDVEAVRHLRWADASVALLGRADILDADPEPADEVEPLPGVFRLSDRGLPIAFRRPGVRGEATGAGGGVGRGLVTHDADDPPSGSVLVVGTLRPDLAPVLPRLAGLVSETGSPLAHLAILAREAGVATVVGYADATAQLVDGDEVEVDGGAGEVRSSDEDEEDR
ncbi:pyruvate, phosphate dikinase [Iamia sp. SCSIO 61187]|uniref:PEP/pyruvate-binding domain-containing protein n=1 Tax=Iamia sp. SCSIO 61187 TaxID=2722752 RepID=UPI001C63966A|nr:PEP/pyruvate-binding domain-containing protein [Iamia sp. SCSIO 61187]QYG93190.1 pyruvate, phosphate dikinase [Iamia sp. SCSIO 61187]